MKIIHPSYEIWAQEKGLNGIYKQIERAGRVCYKSEKNASEDSAKPFVFSEHSQISGYICHSIFQIHMRESIVSISINERRRI